MNKNDLNSDPLEGTATTNSTQWHNRIILSDSLTALQQMPPNFIDLIVTSPPYADSRKRTYGGIGPDDYVTWFLPISQELKEF